MPGGKSNNLETLALNWIFTTGNATRPANWHIGLFTDTAGTFVSNDQPATEATNGTHPGYARQPMASWTVTNNQVQNANPVTFTATGNWGSAVNYFGVFDALTAGNLLYWGPITGKTLANTDQLQFAANAITITED